METKTNLFAKAKAAPAVKASKKSNKAEKPISGMEGFAVVVSLMKNLEGIKATMEGEIKSEMRGIFVVDGEGQRPESFRGVEGSAEASCELRKRTAMSALSQTEIDALTADGIPVGKSESIPERFIINPAYANNQELLAKVSAALSKITELPDDFIQVQAEVSKVIVTDETLEAVCRKVFWKNTSTPLPHWQSSRS